MRRGTVFHFAISIFLLILGGCDSCGCDSLQKKVVVREYVEIEGEVHERGLIQKASSQKTQLNVDSSENVGIEGSYRHQIKGLSPKEFSWKLPSGWSAGAEKPMRIFTAIANTGQECVMTIFPGDVGGLQSNVTRWLQQLGSTLSQQEMTQLLKGVSIRRGDEYPFLFVDLRPVTLDNKESAYVGILRFEDATLFVKFTGTHSSLDANQSKFLDFVKSIAPK